MHPNVRTLTLATWLVGMALVPTIPAQADPIVAFDFNDFNATADVLAPHLTSTDFTAGAGLISASFASGAANSRGWHPSSSAAEALANFDYWEFTVTADPGYQFDLQTLSLNERREVNGPLAFQLYSAGALVGSSLPTAASSTNHVIAAPATDLTSVVVRLLAWNASNNSTTADWFVDGVVLDGTVKPVVEQQTQRLVPEPASVLMLGIGLGLVGARSRMKKRA